MAIITEQQVYDELGLCPPTAKEVAAVQAAIRKAVGAVKRVLGYDPQIGDRVEYYPQRDYTGRHLSSVSEIAGGEWATALRQLTNEFFVQHIPVRQVYGLWVQDDAWSETKADSFGTDTEWFEGEDWWPNYDISILGVPVCRCGIMRTESRWPIRPGAIKISYRAGYTYEELTGQVEGGLDGSDIWEVVLDEAARRAKRTIMQQKKEGVGFVAGNFNSERLGDYSYNLGATGRSDEVTYGNLWDLLPSSLTRLSSHINYGYHLSP